MIAESAAERADSQHCAVLVPDDGCWRTTAGIGLRSLELRCAIADDHWLVETIVRPRRGMVVAQSDIIRPQLVGAPLASRDHLMAVPVMAVPSMDVGAVIIVARDGDRPFEDDELAALADLAREAMPLLADALAVRAAARELARFAELPED